MTNHKASSHQLEFPQYLATQVCRISDATGVPIEHLLVMAVEGFAHSCEANPHFANLVRRRYERGLFGPVSIRNASKGGQL